MVGRAQEMGMKKFLKDDKASQNSVCFFYGGGGGWCKLWFTESCDTLFCIDHEDVFADIPLILSVIFKKPQVSQVLLCSVLTEQLNMCSYFDFSEHSKPNRGPCL